MWKMLLTISNVFKIFKEELLDWCQDEVATQLILSFVSDDVLECEEKEDVLKIIGEIPENSPTKVFISVQDWKQTVVAKKIIGSSRLLKEKVEHQFNFDSVPDRKVVATIFNPPTLDNTWYYVNIGDKNMDKSEEWWEERADTLLSEFTGEE